MDGRLVGDDVDNLSLRIVHGTHIRPVFESLAYDSLDTLTCLVRQLPTATVQQNAAAAGSSNLVVGYLLHILDDKLKRKKIKNCYVLTLGHEISTFLISFQIPKTATAHVLAPGPSMVDKGPTTPGGRKRKQSIGDKTESLAMVDR